MGVKLLGVEIYYKIKYDPKFRPLARKSIRIAKTDKDRYILSNEQTEETYFVDSSAAMIWRLMDGHHSIAAIKKRLGNNHDPEEVEGFINFAAKEQLIEDNEDGASQGKVGVNEKKGPLKPEVISPLVINMPILGASKSSTVFRKLYRVTRIFFTKGFLLFVIVLVGFTAFLLRDFFFSTLTSPAALSIEGSATLGFLVFSLVLIFPILVVHELAHGLALTHFGASPGELGTGLYYFYPMFYCDTSESWRLSRGKRVLVSMVGPLSTLFIGSVAGLLANFNVIPNATYLFQMTFFFSYYLALLNMAPMFETDGYYALMDGLNIPNLRSEAFGYIKTMFTRGPRQANSNYDEYSRRQRLAMIMYGIASVAWSVLTIYLSYLFLIYIFRDAFVQLDTLIGSVVSITGMSITNIGGVLISIGVAVGSLGLLTFISLRLYAMTYLPLKSVASKVQRSGGKALSIDGVYLSAFFLMPVLFPSLREYALKKLRKSARRISQDATITEEGELVTVRMSLDKGTEKAFNQLRSEVIRYENTLRENYNLYVKKLLSVMRKDDNVNEFSRIDRINSHNAASLLKRSDFLKAFKERTDKVNSNIAQLLESFVCFIWSVDMRPEVFARLSPKDFEYSFLEDISTSTSIYDVGTFRRERIIGSKNIENMLRGMSEYFNTAKENPRFMQTTHAAVLYEPIKNRLMIFGRAKRVESLRKVIKRIFLIPTRSTLETTSLQSLSTSLLRLSQFIERTPTFTNENIRATEYKELRLINTTLQNFSRSLEIVQKNIQAIEHLRDTVYLKNREAEKELKSLDYDVALLDLAINASGHEFDLQDNSRVSPSILLRQNRRLSEKLENLKTKVTGALHRKEIDYRQTLRRIGLLTSIGVIISVIIAFYLRDILLQLGPWNLILLFPIATVSLVGLLSLRRALSISGKTHSPIIDSLLLLSNHYYSLASDIPSVDQLLGQVG
jgi:hypothetical protein